MLKKLGLVSPPLSSADHKLFCLANSKHTKMISFLLMYLLNLVLLRLQGLSVSSYMEKSCYISSKYKSSSDNIESEVLLLSYSGVCRRQAMYFHMQAFKDVDIIVCPTTA